MNLPSRTPRITLNSPAPARGVAGEHTSPLNEAQFHSLRQAAAARRPIRNAARTARSSAITILVIGAIGIPILIVSRSWLGLLVVAGICAVGVVEYLGSRRMRRGEPSAAAFLACNQLAFMALIVAYCVIQMLTFSPAKSRATLISPDVEDLLSQAGYGQEANRQFDVWAPIATYGFYSLVIVLSVAFQGGLALYYFTRRRHLQALERSTPEWIARLFRELDG
jgi:hypothetical protein